MKKYIILAMAAASILLAGCGSSDTSECQNDEVKADCNDGKYSKCVDGKWTETLCEGDASCNAENQCGVCKNDAVDETCADGKFKKCTNGQWEDVACEGDASCNAENKCGVCPNDAVDETCADGKFKKCANGQWEDMACEGDASCNAENKCGVCQNDAVDETCADGKYKKCANGQWEETACENNASCNAENKCGECSDGEEKADCKDGKYSKCENGAWVETACADNSSCTKEGTCGKCQEGAVKDCENGENNIGMVTICKDGQWSESKVACPSESGSVSCTADKKCGECLSGDSTKCKEDAADADRVGSAILCKDGKWTTEPAKCPGLTSCAMTDKCYQCNRECDKKFTGENNEACKKECGDCDTKCGECNTGTSKNCKDDSDGVGSADICINGTWKNDNCSVLRSGFTVSCLVEQENNSICGQCKNTKANQCFCINPGHPVYDPSNAFSARTESTCANGYFKKTETCYECVDDDAGACECLVL